MPGFLLEAGKQPQTFPSMVPWLGTLVREMNTGRYRHTDTHRRKQLVGELQKCLHAPTSTCRGADIAASHD